MMSGVQNAARFESIDGNYLSNPFENTILHGFNLGKAIASNQFRLTLLCFWVRMGFLRVILMQFEFINPTHNPMHHFAFYVFVYLVYIMKWISGNQIPSLIIYIEQHVCNITVRIYFIPRLFELADYPD